jgi:sugar phosphate isomerase/epimerase
MARRLTLRPPQPNVSNVRLLQITDLHLSDRTDTPAHDALLWAVAEANRQAPDLVAITGDMTTYGTADATRHFLAAAAELKAPWVFTPGNAELREPGAMPVLAECMGLRSLRVDDVQFLLPDTSTGQITAADRTWLSSVRSEGPLAVLTHYPLDVLDDESRAWMRGWMADRPVELLLAGHRHFSRSRQVDGCMEVITRGLDPDKAFGGPPGVDLLQRRGETWSVEPIPWPHERQLLPAETPHPPVGWSIHGDPAEAVDDARDTGLQVLELRPREASFDLSAIVEGLERLRSTRSLYLSWHLPNLRWKDDTKSVDGHEAVALQIDAARACGVQALTVHVPRIGAQGMYADGVEPTDAWRAFEEAYEALFAPHVAAGVRLSIENVHNASGTPLDRSRRDFATEIGEYEAWIDAVAACLGAADGLVGAHLDVGHARNNGEMGNRQPLGDWYARIGRRITGYHIHQVRPHEDTGKLANHRDITSLYDRTISYAGFVHAWSKGLINRAPLFIEVRDAEERRRTFRLFEELFSA